MFKRLIPIIILVAVFSTQADDMQVPSLEEFGSILGEIAEQVIPCVVTIISRTVIMQSNEEIPQSILLNQEIDPFGADMTYRNPDSEKPCLVQEEQASGVIISSDGYIVTSNHAVAGAYEIEVYLSNGEEYLAEIIGIDGSTDLALIKISGDDFNAIPFGDSDQLMVGEFILAFGSPFTLTQTVSFGIISFLGRCDVGVLDYENYIQTDVLMNPGSSGGALVNLCGELIGINTAIVSQSSSYHGIGFAIPINLVRNIVKELMYQGEVVRGYMGLMVRSLSPEQIWQTENLENGIFVVVVIPGSSADEAGIQRGDIILAIDGEIPESASDFSFQVADLEPGDEIELTLLRGQILLSKIVQLRERPDDQSVSTITPFTGISLGWAVSEMENGMVRIDRIAVTGPAADAELCDGDIIVCVNHAYIDSMDELYISLINSGNEALLTISRDGRTMYISLRF